MMVSLEINQNKEGLFCILDFHNRTPNPFFLNKMDAGMTGEIKSKIFIIKKGDEVIPYTGILIKRGDPTADDFILLKPDEHLKVSVRIDNVYGFYEGNHQYTIQYSRYHSSPEENPPLNKLDSEIVSFNYEK